MKPQNSDTADSQGWLARRLSQRDLQLMLGLLFVIAALSLLEARLTFLADGPVLVSAGLIWAVLVALLFWRRRMVRLAWLRVHMREKSPWTQRLRGGLLMLLGQAVLAAGLTVALLVSLSREIPPTVWLMSVLLVPVWVKAWGGLGHYLSHHVNEDLLPLTTGRVLTWGFGFLAVVALATWGLWRPVPDLGDVTLYEAVRYYAHSQHAESSLLDFLLPVNAAFEGARLWVAQHWFEGAPGLGIRLAAWIVVLIQEWFFVWPCLLLWEVVSHVVYEYVPRTGTCEG